MISIVLIIEYHVLDVPIVSGYMMLVLSYGLSALALVVRIQLHPRLLHKRVVLVLAPVH